MIFNRNGTPAKIQNCCYKQKDKYLISIKVMSRFYYKNKQQIFNTAVSMKDTHSGLQCERQKYNNEQTSLIAKYYFI
jgi:hypothetical protein